MLVKQFYPPHFEIYNHAGNQELIWLGSVARQFVGNAASLALRYPIAALQLLRLRFQFGFAIEA